MRITRENIQQFVDISETLVEQLQAASEAAETWEGYQDEERTADNADEIRDAREELESTLAEIDASSLCQLIHGKHKGK
jgi:hypothetical protein